MNKPKPRPSDTQRKPRQDAPQKAPEWVPSRIVLGGRVTHRIDARGQRIG